MNTFINTIQQAFQSLKWLVDLADNKVLRLVLIGLIVYLGHDYIQNREKVIIDVKQLREHAQQLEKENNQLKFDIEEIKNNAGTANANLYQLPIPLWVKSLNGKMIYVNQAYVKRWLEPMGLTATDYINGYDTQVWGRRLGKRFRRNDSLVISLNKPIRFIEQIGDKEIEVVKFPFRAGPVLFGVAGLEYVKFD